MRDSECVVAGEAHVVAMVVVSFADGGIVVFVDCF